MDDAALSHQAVVIGVSAGGMDALAAIVPELPKDFSLVVVVVQHLRQDSVSTLAEFLNRKSAIVVTEALDKEPMNKGTVYIAPPAYHLQIEENHSFSLSVDPAVNYARPSIDVLFDSAADVYEDRLVGVLLTGANSDGALGLKTIKSKGGLTICQDPATAEAPVMPRAAMELFEVDLVLPLDQIGPYLSKINSDDSYHSSEELI
ncbi:chemotaxis protein CheB [Methylophaga sp. 42_8_T64]|nr:chemotaxis protein CheB [Methylophaga sp. 42_8_T64]